MSDKLASGIKAGSTSVSLPVELLSSTDSTAKTGVVYSDVTASYWRQGGIRTAITTATLGSVSAAWSSGGFLEVDATNMPGVFRFDVPDAAFATGADWVVITLKVAGAFTLNFFFALESVGSAEVYSRIGTAGVGLTNLGDARLANLDATISSRNATTPPSAASIATQVRTELGTELGRIDAAISTRLASAGYTAPDNTNIGTIVARLTATRAALLDNLADLDAAISSRAVPGDQMTLTDAEREATATAVESHLLDEGDSQMLINAIVGAIGNTNLDETALVAALRADLERSGGNLNTLLTRLTSDRAAKLDRDLAEAGDSMTLDPAVRVQLDATQPDYAPAKSTDVPSALSVASAVRDELSVELERIDMPISEVSGGESGTAPTAEEVAAAVVDQALTGHTTSGTVGAALQAAGNSGDPWSATGLDQYPAGTAGKLLNKLNVGTADQSVYVQPGDPVDPTVCLVGGILHRPNGSLAANIKISFELIADSTVRIDGGALVTFEPFDISTDSEGKIFSPSETGTPNPWHAVERNDKIIPAGSKYRVKCRELKLDKEITFITSTFNFAEIVTG